MRLITHFIDGWSDHVEIYFLYKTQVAEAMQWVSTIGKRGTTLERTACCDRFSEVRQQRPNFLECVLFHQVGSSVHTKWCTFLSPSLYSGQIKPLPLWHTHLSARMAIGRELLVIFAVGTLGFVQGFGLGPSLEWKDGDAEMWAQVCIIFNARLKLEAILSLTFRCPRLPYSSQVRRHQRYFCEI